MYMQALASKTSVKSLELLSPCKNFKSAIKAISCGADAIFIGGPAFGARASAGNSLEELEKIVKFAHLFKVKVHVTLNTLLYDNELNEAQELIYAYAKIGVDVLIVQDLAIFKLKIPKCLELHASTQCCIDSVDKLKFYESLGVKQVVLPREFTKAQIQEFKKACPKLRLEAFVMGALCVGVSGICYISEYLKDRSANRGNCAQICRLPMQLMHQNKEIKRGFLLSLKDNLQVQNLEDMIEAGVESFKIEGRLKDENYVANTTAYFRLELDRLIKNNHNLKRQAQGKISINFTPDLNKSFNRGFTDGLYKDNKDNLVNDLTPKFVGPKVAIVKSCQVQNKLTKIELKKLVKSSFSVNDSLCFFKEPKVKTGNLIEKTLIQVDGFKISSIVLDNPNTATILAFGAVRLTEGTALYQNVDAAFEKSLNQKDASKRERFYNLTLKVKATLTDVTLTLLLTDENEVTAADSVTFNFDEKSNSQSKDKLIEILSKSIDPHLKAKAIAFEFDNVDINLQDKIFTFKASVLNALRKSVQEQYLNKITTNKCDISDCYEFDFANLKAFAPTVDKRLVLNHLSKEIYSDAGFTIKAQDSVVMTCKYCLINQYATCSKKGGKVSGYALIVSGKKFLIKTDCKKCRMMLVKA